MTGELKRRFDNLIGGIEVVLGYARHGDGCGVNLRWNPREHRLVPGSCKCGLMNAAEMLSGDIRALAELLEQEVTG